MIRRWSKLREAEAAAMLHLAVTAGNRLQNDEPLLVMPKDALNADSITHEEGPPSNKANDLLRESEWALRQVVGEIADTIRARICGTVVASLKALPGMLATPDSRLQNAWDEICVQIQGPASIHWGDALIPTVEQLIQTAIGQLTASERRALWLLSYKGSNWLDDLAEKGDAKASAFYGSSIPYDDESVVALLRDNVFTAAGKYTGPSIDARLDSDCSP